MIALVGVDLLYYTYHRIAHRVRLIWATHQAHHSSQYFNFATALRQKWNNSGEILMWIPLPLFGVPPWMVFASFSVSLIYQFWIHTERIGKLWRPVEFVFNTPSHHRVHHGMDAEYLDKNYGGILIVWDRMFGTFQPELFRPHYGLTKPVDTFNIWKLQTHEYVAIARDVRVAPTAGATSSATSSDRPAGSRPRPSAATCPRPPLPPNPSRDVVVSGKDGGMDVKEMLLPGVGLRYEFDIRDGDRIGVIARRSGDFELVIYSRDDPDEARPLFRLTERGGRSAGPDPRGAADRRDASQTSPGKFRGSTPGRWRSARTARSSDRPLGDTRARTRTGASIVAIVRDDEVLVSPGPTELLRSGRRAGGDRHRGRHRRRRAHRRAGRRPAHRPRADGAGFGDAAS